MDIVTAFENICELYPTPEAWKAWLQLHDRKDTDVEWWDSFLTVEEFFRQIEKIELL